MVSFLQSRLSFLIACVLVFLGVMCGLCGGNSMTCLAVVLTDGLVALVWVGSAAALGWFILRRFGFISNASLRLATGGGLGLGIFSLLGLGLGLLGWLNRPVAISFPVISVVLFVADTMNRHPGRVNREQIKTWLRESAGAAWLWLIPVASLAIAAVSASIMPGILWKSAGDPHPYDVTSYHLLVPREWYEGGRIVPLDHNMFSYFPFNVEMQFLLLMHVMGGPWTAMYACQFVSVGYAGLMILAIAGAGKDEHSTSNIQHPTSNAESPSSLRRSMFDVRCSVFAFNSMTAAGFAAVVPWVIMLAGVAYVESALMLYTALSIAWALHAIANPDRLIKSMILAGIMAGFACGVKITAVPMLLIAVPIAMIVVTRSAEFSIKRILIGCCGFGIAGLVVLLPWLMRNIAWSGNPLFPVGMSVLGKGHFTDQQVERFRIAHSPISAQKSLGSKLRILKNGVIEHWQFGTIFFPVALVAIVMGWKDRHVWMLLICGLFVLIVWIGFTHLLPRFAVMLIPIGAMAIGRIQWARAWPVGLLLLLISAGFGWAGVIPELCHQSDPPLFHGQPAPVFIGFEDVEKMMSPELVDARDRGLQIGLVGDAQGFLYDIPMSRLHYRTVFDLQPGDPIDAWVGSQAKGDPNWLLVINPMEIDRLNKTYIGVPPVPPAWAAHEPDSFFMRGDAFK
jgi:hypothetical protein